MVLLLAFIGLAFVLWLASKALMKVGNILENISANMEDRALSAEHLRKEQLKSLRKIENRIQTLEETDDFMDKAKKEIEELTNEE